MISNRYPLIITGPTASGKTDLAEEIAQQMGGEIINIDVGQFYEPLSVGTAKPDWQKKSFTCHFFDILNEPCELSVAAYRNRMLTLVDEIVRRGKLPIIVGGSLFYIKSLFFPPHEQFLQKDLHRDQECIDLSSSSSELWNTLNNIDPIRAQALHHNDRYRIVRALQIWQTTGQKPSNFEPRFNPPFSAHIIFLVPPKDILLQRISMRTRQMIDSGAWIHEAKNLLGSPWEDFIRRKGLIGYTQIFEWLKFRTTPLDELIADIVQETNQYAKRQMVFLKKFKKQLEEQVLHSSQTISFREISGATHTSFDFSTSRSDFPSNKQGER